MRILFLVGRLAEDIGQDDAVERGDIYLSISIYLYIYVYLAICVYLSIYMIYKYAHPLSCRPPRRRHRPG